MIDLIYQFIWTELRCLPGHNNGLRLWLYEVPDAVDLNDLRIEIF